MVSEKKENQRFSLRGETDYTSRAKPKDICRVKVVLSCLTGLEDGK